MKMELVIYAIKSLRIQV